MGIQEGYINPQITSPFCQRLPAEIRLLIFDFALQEYDLPEQPFASHDFCVRFDHATYASDHTVSGRCSCKRPHLYGGDPGTGYDWLRPGHVAAQGISIGLLSTCRLIYLEARDILFKNRLFRLYGSNGPPCSAFSAANGKAEIGMDKATFREGLALIRHVHCFPKVYQLQDTSAEEFWTVLDSMVNLESIRITIRHKDWSSCSASQYPMINPFLKRRELSFVVGKRGLRREHENILMAVPPETCTDFEVESWGSRLKQFQKLKSLIIDFEAAHDTKVCMEAIVEWAQGWQLPLSVPGTCLSADGIPVEKMSWRGFPWHWGPCPMCRSGVRNPRGDCQVCFRRTQMCQWDCGPRLFVWTLTWQAAQYPDYHVGVAETPTEKQEKD